MFPIDNSKIRLLIVDDEPAIRNLLSICLSEFYECVQADSAETALAKIQQQSFGVIITDINMPGMSGLEMVDYISKRSSEIVCLVISGQKSIDNAIAALRVGAFDYLVKPFDLLQVETIVNRAAEHYQLRVFKRNHEQNLEEFVNRRTIELNLALAELNDAFREIENSYRATLKALVKALETRVFETYGHYERVVTYSLRLGYEMKLDEQQLRSLEFGALLHDIGKIGIPDSILRKPGKLDEEDWKKVKLHPVHGEQILRDVPFLEEANRIVAQHHERWDGTGYPLGLKGEEIDLNARIFSVVDAFDAITSDHLYRAGKSYQDAVVEINNCSGTQFDPQVVAAFQRVPEEDWDALYRHSWSRKTEEFSFQTVVADLMKKRASAELIFAD